jgi:hypothetical protein
MGELAKSVRLFAGGIIRRLWSLIPGVLLGLIGIYDALIKPFLPPEWQRVSLAVPLPFVAVLLGLGLVWAAVLTFHELRMQAATLPLPPSITVATGATVVYAPTAQTVSVTSAAGGRGTRVRMSGPVPPGQTKLWTDD